MERVKSTKAIMRKIVLETDCDFELSDVLIRLKRLEKGRMSDDDIAECTTEVVDELRDSGLIIYGEVGKDIWAYRSNIGFDPNSKNQQKVSREIRRRELGIHLVEQAE